MRRDLRPGLENAWPALASVALAFILLLSSTHAFAAVPPSISATPSSFASGATVTVSGSGFSGGTLKVWLDLFNDGRLDAGDPFVTVSGSGGSFTTPLPVGAVPVGTYSIDAGSGTSAAASTPVTVVDSATQGAISAAVATLEGDLAGLQSHVDTSLIGVQTHLDSTISDAASYVESSIALQLAVLQSDLDTRLGTFNNGDSAASLLYAIDSKVSTSPAAVATSASGTCTAPLDNTGHTQFTTCTIMSLPADGAVTLSLQIQGPDFEAGGSVDLAWGEPGCTFTSCAYFMESVIGCGAGTCHPQSITVNLAGGTVMLNVGCSGLGASCSDPITVEYTAVAVGPQS